MTPDTEIHKAYIQQRMIKDGDNDVAINIVCRPPPDMHYMITTIDKDVTCKRCNTVIFHNKEKNES